MDGGDMLEERKYMVLSEKTIEKLIIIEKIVGGDRARKAIARWITVNISLSFDESDLYEWMNEWLHSDRQVIKFDEKKKIQKHV